MHYSGSRDGPTSRLHKADTATIAMAGRRHARGDGDVIGRIGRAAMIVCLGVLGATVGRLGYGADNLYLGARQLEAMGARVIRNPTGVPVSVDLRGTVLDDDDMAILGKMPQLLRVLLTDTQVTDAGVADLAPLKNLASLELPPAATDASLDTISQWDSLQAVGLYATKITDGGLEKLTALKKLAWLSLAGTGVGDRGMKHVGTIDSLRYLDLLGTKVTDQGVAELRPLRQIEVLVAPRGTGNAATKHIVQMTTLRELWLSDSALTDDGVGELARLPQLKVLCLYNSLVTDASIPMLSTMKSLDNLNLGRTRVSRKGAADLRRALPSASIHWSPNEPDSD